MIEPVNAGNIEEVLPLIRRYQAFYGITSIDDEKNRKFFSQFGTSSEKGCLFAYREAGTIVGFATLFFCYASSITAKVAVMNDLYTEEGFRGNGIGRSLILHCEAYGKSQGAVRLQWVTASDNRLAKALYESMGAEQSNWDFFTYKS